MDRLTDILFAMTVLLAVLVATTEQFSSVHLVLMYLFLIAIAFNQYDSRIHGDISPLFSLQVGLTFGLGTILIILVVGGLGFRRLELLAVFFVLFAFVLARDDLVGFLPTAAPYLGAAAAVTGIFLFHAQEFGSGSGLGLFPVFAAIVLAFNLFVLPRYVSADAVYWTVATVTAGITAMSLPAVIYGDFSLWIFEVRTWTGSLSPPLLDRDVPIVRSIFANPNTFGLLVFPGVVASAVTAHRTVTRSSSPLLATVPLGCLGITAIGLYLSNSRASMLAAAVAVGVYALAVTNRRLIPAILVGVGLLVPLFLTLVYVGVLPIDPAHRFTLWRAGVDAMRHDSGLLGQGLIGTGAAIEPYLDGGGSVHSSYLSIGIRAGLLGGLAYCVLVFGSLIHGIAGYRRVNVGMLALATGFAVHQLFEGYTLFSLGPGSIFGALAIGYIIASLAGEPAAGVPNETEHRVGSERATRENVRYGSDV